MSVLGTLVASQRAKMQIPARQLASKIGISAMTLLRFETGENKTLSLVYWCALAHELELSHDEILSAYERDMRFNYESSVNLAKNFLAQKKVKI